MANVDKLVVAFDERRHSLMQDGYNIITSTYTDKFMYNKFRHSNGNYVSIIAYIDDCSITTDVIVGFPGESEEEFKETCDNIRKIGFTKIHVFPFSSREGTVASKLPN